MSTLANFPFFPLHFSNDGSATSPATEQPPLLAAAGAATDLILLAHGFRNNEADATDLYTKFLTAFDRQRQRPEVQASLSPRRIMTAGLFWPSKALPETFDTNTGGGTNTASVGDDPALMQKAKVRARLLSLRDHDATPQQQGELNAALALLDQVQQSQGAQDSFVRHVLALAGDPHVDPTEGLLKVATRPGSELLMRMGPQFPIAPIAAPPADGGEVMSVDFGGGGALGLGSVFGSIFGHINQLLNLTTWYVMKNRSGQVGEVGLAPLVRQLRAQTPALKIHLVGHSLGGRLMAACVKQLAAAPTVHVESLTLLEAAFSHYGFSANNGDGVPGYFRDAVTAKVVQGPAVATFSAQDSVVGLAYALASRLADDNTKAVGDQNDPFGGLGRNGCQKTRESDSAKLAAFPRAGGAYQFAPGTIHCLDGSGGLIHDHSDVTNDAVVYAFTSAISAT